MAALDAGRRAAIGMMVAPGIGVTAENAAATPELVKVMASDQVTTAVWTRHPDSYTFRLVLDVAAYDAKQRAMVSANPAKVPLPGRTG